MKYARKLLVQLGLLAALTGASSALLAQPSEGRDGPPKPPKEALESCKSLSAGQACSFTMPKGTVNGACWAPEGKPLACKPKDAAGGESRPSKQSSSERSDGRQALLQKVALHLSVTSTHAM
jgi:hypothetical protein